MTHHLLWFRAISNEFGRLKNPGFNEKIKSVIKRMHGTHKPHKPADYQTRLKLEAEIHLYCLQVCLRLRADVAVADR